MKKKTGDNQPTNASQGTPNTFHGIIKGRVQGVGYRVFAREAALRHGVNGWVRNRRDGTVEIHAEATELVLTEFLTELYRGPILGHVTDIQLTWSTAEPTHQSFEILR